MENLREKIKTEHKVICAKNQLRSLYLDCYPYFGWEFYKTKGKSVLYFKKEKEDLSLSFLQDRFDEAVGIIKKCHRIQRLCSDAAFLVSVIIAIVYFIVVEKNVAGWQSEYKLIVHIMMTLFIVLPFFAYGFARKSCLMITKTAVDAKLAEIREICEEAKKIHNTKAENAIFILLTKPSTYISKVINFKTKDKYTHASIAFSNDLNIVFSFSRKWVWMPLPAGFRLEHLTKSFRNKKDEVTCALYKLMVDESVYMRAKQRVEQMIIEAPIYSFNLLGLFLCGFGIPLRRKKSYFCSEFVSEILSFSNALKLPKEPALMRPNDYTDIPELSCVYEGKLSELSKKCK